MISLLSRRTPQITGLDKHEAYSLLSNERRERTLTAVAELDDGEHLSFRELVEAVASQENECDPYELSGQQKKRVRTALWQAHLDKLEAAGAIKRPDEHEIVKGPNTEALQLFNQSGEDYIDE